MNHKTMKLKKLLNTLSSREFISIRNKDGSRLYYSGYVEDFERTWLLIEENRKELKNTKVRNLHFSHTEDNGLVVNVYLQEEEQ